jgi:hypothetical protein
MEFALRLNNFKSNVFADMDRAKAQAKLKGREIIDLSLGSSDLPVSPNILSAIRESLDDPLTHGYLLHNGTKDFREAVASWYIRRYGVDIDPESEVIPLIGSQEGTAHLPLCLLNPGDYVLVLDPGYPSHIGGVHLAGANPYFMTLREENNFLPVFSEIPHSVLQQCKLMILSYPHNPTAAIAPFSFFQEALEFCQKWNIVLAHDFPYMDMVYQGHKMATSIFQVDRNKDCSIEFFSFSKSYSMGGFRIGFAIGNSQLIKALAQVKAAIDFNQYRGILNGGMAALSSPEEKVQEIVNTFEARRDALTSELAKYGWKVPIPPSTMYLWAKIPRSKSFTGSLDFALQLVESTGVALSPGIGFGQAGEGYVRFALVRESSVLVSAAQKITHFLDKSLEIT